MAQANPRLTRRTVVLAKIETTVGVDALPTAASDAFLIEAPDFTPNIQMLERDYVHGDLSPVGVRAARRLGMMKMTLEARGNGQAGVAPLIGRLLQSCGYSQTVLSGSNQIGSVRDDNLFPSGVTWANGGSPTNSYYMDYLLTCVVGGASATAEIRVDELNGYEPTLLMNENINISTESAAGTLVVDTSSPLAPTITVGGTWATGDLINFNVYGFVGQYTTTSSNSTDQVGTGLAAAINAVLPASIQFADTTSVLTGTPSSATTGTAVTSGSTALALGSSGATVTPTWSGNLTVGQTWRVSVAPPGVLYMPISVNQPTLTIYMYMDGLLHKMTGSLGTFTLDAKAGEYGKFMFEFTGQWNDPIDAALPVILDYPINPEPPTLQLALLRLGSENITVQTLSFTQGNTVVPREDVNSTDGYTGVRITARKPVGGVDPEATYTGDFNFWQKLSQSVYMQFSLRIGSAAGNTIWMKGPNVQYSKASYKDRTGIRVYDAGLSFAREQGDDENLFHFS